MAVRKKTIAPVDEKQIRDTVKRNIKYPDEDIDIASTFSITLSNLIYKKLSEKVFTDQKSIAEAAGITGSQLSEYKSGNAEPTVSKVVKLAKALDVDCNYLLTGVSAANRTVNNDLGLTDTAIMALKFISSPPDELSSYNKIQILKVITIINLLLDDFYKDLSFRPFGPDDIDGINVLTAMYDYIYGSDSIRGEIVLDDGGPIQMWSAKYLWPEKCLSDIRNRLDVFRRRKEEKKNG